MITNELLQQAIKETAEGMRSGDPDYACKSVVWSDGSRARAAEQRERAEKAEAELAALRARISASPYETFVCRYIGTQHAYLETSFAKPEWIGKRVRLLVEDGTV